MLTAVKTCYLKKYADFRTRATPGEFWSFHIFNWLVAFGALLIAAAYQAAFGLESGSLPLMVVTVPLVAMVAILLVASIIPSFAVMARRLHDTNASAAWMLVVFVPFGVLALLIWTFIPGTAGDNSFGPPPGDGLREPGPRDFAAQS